MTPKTSVTKTIKLKNFKKKNNNSFITKITWTLRTKKKEKKHSDKQYLNNVRVKMSKEMNISFFFVVFDRLLIQSNELSL